jgi:hypothetical protein
MDASPHLRRELAKLLFGLCCALGGLAGLWLAIVAVTPGQELAEIARTAGLRFGVCFGVGSAAGLLLAVPLRRR